MDKKLNLTDLCEFYVKASGVSGAEAELFARSFFDVVVEGLEKDGSVKINGLGTFKVVEVESRSSVNISTGERFEISGHNRITFIPADSLKDTINAPFAMFEPVEVDDDIDNEEEEKDFSNDDVRAEDNVKSEVGAEIVDTQSIENMPVADELPIIEASVAVVDIEEEMPVDAAEDDGRATRNVYIEEEMPAVESDCFSENVSANIVAATGTINDESLHKEIASNEFAGEAQIVNKVVPSDVKEDNGAESDAIAINNEEKKSSKEKLTPPDDKDIFLNTLPREKKHCSYAKLYMLSAVVIVCAALSIIGYNIYKNNIHLLDNTKEQSVEVKKVNADVSENVSDNVDDKIAIANDSVENVVVNIVDSVQQTVVEHKDTLIEEIKQEPVKPETNSNMGFKLVDALAARELSTIFVADTTDYRISGSMCVHKVKSEETLIKISQKYYGDKRLWPYIVKYNNMLRPNDLACDMQLKIPRLIPKK